jgi:hypothetical protein
MVTVRLAPLSNGICGAGSQPVAPGVEFSWSTNPAADAGHSSNTALVAVRVRVSRGAADGAAETNTSNVARAVAPRLSVTVSATA